MVGLGGGFLIVPALILTFKLPPQNAVAVSLVAILGATASAAVAYARQGAVNYALGLLYDVLDVPGVAVGAYLTTVLSPDLLAKVVGLLIASISIALIAYRGPRPPSRTAIGASPLGSGPRLGRPRLVLAALLSSFAGGVVTGLAGLGGGSRGHRDHDPAQSPRPRGGREL